jgi:preprotein translocase subunit SecA
LVREVERLHAERRPLLIGTRTIAASEELAGRLMRKGVSFNLLNATRHREEARIVAGAGQAGEITIATNMAGRGTDIVLGPGVRELGGLHVIAAEPNDSHRIDRQLFGRSGRQGDPGSAQLFTSMDDELLARYAPAFLRKRVAGALAYHAPAAPSAPRNDGALSKGAMSCNWTSGSRNRSPLPARGNETKPSNDLDPSPPRPRPFCPFGPFFSSS